MFIVDLSCAAGHRFEGWYDDAREYHALAASGEITCPLCGTAEVERLPSATRISTTTTRGEKTRAQATSAPAPPAPASEPPMPLPVQKALAKMIEQVRRTHEFVGDQFAARAIAMHKGEEEPRPIHGQASPEDEERLDDEGVPYLKVPVPDIEKN